jgi:hypothetical protein
MPHFIVYSYSYPVGKAALLSRGVAICVKRETNNRNMAI